MRRSSLKHGLATITFLLSLGAVAQAAEKVVFLIDWLPGGDKAVPYLAVQKGLFAAEGLEVTIQSGRGSTDVITKLATGTADMGTGALAALLQAKAESNAPASAVLSIYPVQPDAIFTYEGSGIATLKDIEGKKVATASFSSSNVVWPLILQTNGIDPAKVNLIKVDPSALAPLLASGQTAATINWLTVVPSFERAFADAGKKLRVIPWSDYGFEGYGLSLLASDKMIAQRPEVVRKVIKVMAEANRMAIADPKLAADALRAMVPEIDAAIAERQFRVTIPLMENAISKSEGTGAFEKARLAKTWQWTAKAQNIPLDKIDPEKAIARAFVPR